MVLDYKVFFFFNSSTYYFFLSWESVSISDNIKTLGLLQKL